jgi:hypothetical protein
MKRKILYLTSILIIWTSCKVTERNIIGTYSLKNYPKTILKLNNDKSFEFIKNISNPYLHPFEHTDEYFFKTSGTWIFSNNNKISITSISDSIKYDLVKISTQKPRQLDRSYFTFFDSYGDTIPILYAQYSDSTVTMKMHGSMSNYWEDLTKRDTLQFYFYGYRPYTIINNFNENRDFNIILIPEFRPSYFKNAEFALKFNKLIDSKYKVKFKK